MIRIFIAGCMVVLSSCEGFINLTGKVVEDREGHPLPHASVQLLGIPSDSIATTYIDGNFTVRSKLIGMMTRPKFGLEIRREGYYPMIMYFSRKDKIVPDIFRLYPGDRHPNIVVLSRVPADIVMDSVVGSKSFEPSGEEFLLADELFRQAVASNYGPDKFRHAWLEKYSRQYVAYVDPAGDKMIWVSAFCDSRFYPDWRTQLVPYSAVGDGGDCYFRVTLNLSKKTFSRLVTNGRG